MADETKRVLVAGATGYVGKFVVQAFKERGYWVRALTRDEDRLRKTGPFTAPGIDADGVDEVFVGEITDPGNIEVTINKKSVTEDNKGADKQPHLHHAPAVGCAKSAWPNGGQATLFADDRRAGRKTRRKSNHRIRAYRGTSKKRANQQVKGQGTLFEVNGPSQSAA